MPVIIEGLDEDMQYLKDATERAIAGTIIEVASRVAERTPVDTGFAKNSWYSTYQSEDYGTPGSNDPAASALAVAAQYSLGKTVYINNGAEYISALENGHSDQAPQGMVRVTLPEVEGILEDQGAVS